jgi:acyl-coenzyme A synthetase/AMP-(fatty) acid ligase
MTTKRWIAAGQRGWVTVEMAFAAVGIGAAVVVCVGIFSVCLMQMRCSDAATEIARQAARDDQVAVQTVEDRLSPAAKVTVSKQGDSVAVVVTVAVRPWGHWLPALTVRAEASAVGEGVGP